MAAQKVSESGMDAAAPITDEVLAASVDEVKGANWAYVSEIVRAGPERAAPILKKLFVTVPDSTTKAAIALALIKMGSDENEYWAFLLTRAKETLASDAPFPPFDTKGTVMPTDVSPRFKAWADAHSLTISDAAELVTFGLPTRLLQLAMTGDPRAVPILRQGLNSNNVLTQLVSAEGLAGLRDRDSIPLIVEACRRSPENAGALAMAGLMAFGDAEAQRSAEPFLSLEQLKALHNGESSPGSEPFRKTKSVEK